MTQHLLILAIAMLAGLVAAGAVWIAPELFSRWRASAARQKKLQADSAALLEQAKAKERKPGAK